MSREIKFRCWNKKLNSWLIWFDLDYSGKVINSNLNGIYIYDTYQAYQKYCVVEQYTGLKDKNGKEIYEGDIVEFGLSGRAERGYVAYADEYASFEVYSKRDFIFGCLFSHAGKVIGNIHENPELLEDNHD